MGVMLTGASPSDHQPVGALRDSFSHHLTRVLGDGASNDADLQRTRSPSRSLTLLAPVMVNHLSVRYQPAQHQLNA